jgi:TonB family protein
MERIVDRLSLLRVSVLALLMCLSMSARAQNENTKDSNWKFSHPLLVKEPLPAQPKYNYNKDGKATAPEFPGGDLKLQQYLKKKTKSVSSRRNGNGQGKVVVSFMVSEKGKLSDFKVTKSTNASLNRDAMNIIKSMPNWTPAKRDGKNVKSKMSVVVNFE